MKQQFVTFMAIAGVSAALVGCGASKSEIPTNTETAVESASPEATNETTNEIDEILTEESTSTTEDTEEAAETVPSESPVLESEQTHEKLEATTKPEVSAKPEATTKPEASAKPQATTKPETSTKPQATTKPEASTKPQATTKPEASTKPQTTTKPETSTKPQATTKPEASPKPEASTKPEETTKPESTSLSSREVFSQITSGLELPGQTELDADLLMNLYGIDANLLESYCVKMPMMSFQITEIGVFKVKDVNNVDSIVSGIHKRANSVGGMLYPSLQETFDSRVIVTKGPYILFAMDENASTIEANFNRLIQ